MIHKPFARLWLTTLLAFVLVLLALPPFYGFMDDLTNLQTAKDMTERGALNYLKDWLPYDYAASGRIRPFLPFMAWGIYTPALGSPLGLHLWNGFLTLGTLGLLALGFARLWRLVYGEKEDISAIFFALMLLFPWTHLVVILPAMQEKMILLAAALTLLAFTSPAVISWPVWIRMPSLIFLLACGTFVREQYILFYPAFFAASWCQDKKPFRWETWLYFCAMLGLIVLVWWLGRGNPYKSRYGLEAAFVTLQNSRSLWLFLALALTSFVCLFSKKDFLARTFPATSLLGFLLLMIPWGLGGYLNSIAAPLFAAAVLAIFSGFLKRKPFIVFAAGLLLFTGEIILDASVKRDLRLALESQELKVLAQTHTLYAPCDEGSGYIKRYAKEYFGYELDVKVPPALADLRAQHSGPTYWFVGKHLSCWPGSFDPEALVKSGEAKVLWQGSHAWSHRILEIH